MPKPWRSAPSQAFPQHSACRVPVLEWSPDHRPPLICSTPISGSLLAWCTRPLLPLSRFLKNKCIYFSHIIGTHTKSFCSDCFLCLDVFPCCWSVTQSCLSLQSHRLQPTRLPCPSLSPGVCSNSHPLSQWCHPNISSSVALFASCPQSFLALRSFAVSWLFTSGGQSIEASASASVLPMSIQGWFPLGLTGFISLQSKGLSRVFCSTTVRKHQFFGPQLSLWFTSHIPTWLLEKP